MAAFVLDCSVALAWFLPGERAAATDALLDQATEVGALVPGLWRLEVGNVLLIAERKGRIERTHRLTPPYSSLHEIVTCTFRITS
jgi:predicted nucleic acid-binding protein